MTPSRRKFLERAGAAAATVAVGTAGGHAVGAQEDGGEVPEYGRWLTLEDGSLEFTYADWSTLGEYATEDLEEETPEEVEVPEEYEDDPMIAPASDGLVWAYFFVGIDLARFGLGRLLDDDEAFESTVEELLQVNDAFVVTGAIEPDEIDDRLTAAPELEFLVRMERTDRFDEYDVYTPVEEDVDAAIAVSSDALVIVADADGDPLSTLETSAGAAAGDVDRATDESEALEWLVGTAGDGDVVVGHYGDPVDPEIEFDVEELEGAEGVVTSLTVEDEGTSTGEFAAIVDEPDAAALEAVVGATATERSFEVDGNRVTASGLWRAEDLTVDRLQSRPVPGRGGR